MAKLFCTPLSVEEMADVVCAFPGERKLVIGRGCNLFFTENFDGLVIRPAIFGIKILQENDQYVDIEAGAAEDWDAFVHHCVEHGYAGLENLSLIPGLVGASPVQNIGAYGVEAKDTIVCVKAVNLQTSDSVEFSREECEFGYRDSIFKRTGLYAITSVVFRLKKTFKYEETYDELHRALKGIPFPTLAQVRDAVMSIRERKLPDYLFLPNAGSFFKNPVITKAEKKRLQEILPEAPIYALRDGMFKTSAAYLIDKAGYRGKRSGMVGVYAYHALMIVNYGTDDGREIVDFMLEVQYEVQQRFGIMLVPEVQIY